MVRVLVLQLCADKIYMPSFQSPNALDPAAIEPWFLNSKSQAMCSFKVSTPRQRGREGDSIIPRGVRPPTDRLVERVEDPFFDP